MNRSGMVHCDICDTQEILVTHHISGRDIPKPNHPSNLTDICCNCHQKVHSGLIIIEGWFKTTNGLELLWHSVDKESFSGRDSNPYLIP